MTLKTTIKTGFFIAACCFSLSAEAQEPAKKFGKEMPYVFYDLNKLDFIFF